jgi:subtilisin family serine protease
MVIAVLDGGFDGADVHPVFDSLRNNNQILGTKDFVNIGGNVYTESEHGKSVLSCIGANSPGQMIGTAPKASFWLLHSEDVKSENIIEEYNWVSAAEFADSVGADVINSSLSYQEFDDAQWTYDYEDMDGNTAVSTIGADIAVSKGILICNSAGNSGNSSFPWNGAPADADSVISVGAVNNQDQRVSFSSIGPTADDRIRPVVMALGGDATIAWGDQWVGTGSGTSFSSPILAGMATCLWQANPTMKVMDVYNAIRQSGSMSANPDNYMGYGIPDFVLANTILSTEENKVNKQRDMIRAWPNPFNTIIHLDLSIPQSKQFSLEVRNMQGMLLQKVDQQITTNNKHIQLELDLNSLPSGVYFVKVTTSEGTDVQPIVKK